MRNGGREAGRGATWREGRAAEGRHCREDVIGRHDLARNRPFWHLSRPLDDPRLPARSPPSPRSVASLRLTHRPPTLACTHPDPHVHPPPPRRVACSLHVLHVSFVTCRHSPTRRMHSLRSISPFRISRFAFHFEGLGCRISCLRVQGSGFRVCRPDTTLPCRGLALEKRSGTSPCITLTPISHLP